MVELCQYRTSLAESIMRYRCSVLSNNSSFVMCTIRSLESLQVYPPREFHFCYYHIQTTIILLQWVYDGKNDL